MPYSTKFLESLPSMSQNNLLALFLLLLLLRRRRRCCRRRRRSAAPSPSATWSCFLDNAFSTCHDNAFSTCQAGRGDVPFSPCLETACFPSMQSYLGTDHDKKGEVSSLGTTSITNLAPICVSRRDTISAHTQSLYGINGCMALMDVWH